MLFLGNIQPDLQRDVRRQSSASFAALDSMNLWIETARDSLVAAIGEVDCLLLNDAELRMLTEQPNLVKAATAAMAMGPESRRRQARRVRSAAVHRRRPVRDPRRCRWRTFATRPAPATASPAAFSATSMRCESTAEHDERALRRAMAYGSVMASFNVEDFGTERVASSDRGRDRRAAGRVQALTHFDE